MNYDLIKKLTTTCPPGTLLNNQENFKISCIINQINNKKFDVILENGYILITHKHFNNLKPFITISSHVDNVYNNCFCKLENEYLVGTFDNSITNYAIIELLRSIRNKQIVYIFTDNEEINNSTISNVPLLQNKNFLFNICLDVTPYCHFTHVATIENDIFALAQIKNKKIAFIQPYQSMNDESISLQNINIKSFSFCITGNFDCNRCHSEKGGIISLKKYRKYLILLKKLLRNIKF